MVKQIQTNEKNQIGKLYLIALVLLAFIFLINNVLALSTTATVDFNSNVGQIRSDFYGVNTHGNYLTLPNSSSWNITYNQIMFNNSRMNIIRVDGLLDRYSNINTYSDPDRLARLLNLTTLARANNWKILVTLVQTPTFLANSTIVEAPCGTDNKTCPPTNYTAYANITVDLLNRIGCDENTCIAEIRNEPDYSGFWIAGIGSDVTNATIRSKYYNLLFNYSYYAIRKSFPNMQIYAPSFTTSDARGSTMITQFTRNFTENRGYYNITISTHRYLQSGDAFTGTNFGTILNDRFTNIISNCTSSGFSCNHMSLSEFGIINSTITNNLTNFNEYAMFYSSALNWILNNYPANISTVSYEWSNSAFGMLNETGGYTNANYNVTKIFATNHKANNYVVTSSTDASTVKIVASYDSTFKKFITVTNTNTSSFNVTINGVTSGMRNVETGEIYPVNSGSVTILNMPSYGVYTLESTNSPQISFVSPTPTNGSTVPTRNFIINATIDTSNPLSSIIYTWNNTNYSIYDDSCIFGYDFENRSAFSENHTYIRDVCRNNNITMFNGANYTFSQGIVNKGINFSGRSSYGILNHTRENLTNGFTLSVWTNTVETRQQVVLNGNIFLQYESNNNLRISIKMDNGTTILDQSPPSLVNQNAWQNFVFVFNNSILKIYRNNINIYNYSGNGTFGLGTGHYIGSLSPNSRIFNGTIDRVRLWNYALNESQINFYNNTLYDRINNTRSIFTMNQSNISGINYNAYNIFVNDSSNNQNQSNRLIRILSNIYFSSTSKGIVRSDFYGTNIHNTNGLYSDTDASWIMDKYTTSKMKSQRIDASLNYYYNGTYNATNQSFFRIGNLNSTLQLVRDAYNNNSKVLISMNYMIYFLSNNTYGCTNICPPLDYDMWGKITSDYINRTTNDGQYSSAVYVEVWNEPDVPQFFMETISANNINRSLFYNKMYNATQYYIKNNYPDIKVGSPSMGDSVSTNNILMTGFLSNFSQRMDFLSIHDYWNVDANAYNNYLNLTNAYFNLCNNYNANCSHIIWGEWNAVDDVIKNTSSRSQEYLAQLSGSYSAFLLYPANISSVFYQFTSMTNYTISDPDYPQKYGMILSPRFNGGETYPSFWVTSNFTRYAPALGTVYTTTNDNSELIQVQVREVGGADNLIVTNTYNDEQNITLNCGTYTGNLIDVSSGSLYSCASGSVNLGVLDAYDVRYYTEPRIVTDSVNAYYANYLNEIIRPLYSYELTGDDSVEIGNNSIIAQFLVGIAMFGLIFLVIGASAVYTIWNGGDLEDINLRALIVTLVSIILIAVITIYIVGNI
jgi:hypothetical protein